MNVTQKLRLIFGSIQGKGEDSVYKLPTMVQIIFYRLCHLNVQVTVVH